MAGEGALRKTRVRRKKRIFARHYVRVGGKEFCYYRVRKHHVEFRDIGKHCGTGKRYDSEKTTGRD